MGWMYYWLVFVFFCLLSGAILNIILFHKEEYFLLLNFALWIICLFFVVVLIFGFQITVITEKGILQKKLFRKQVFLEWQEVRKIETLKIFCFKFFYITTILYERSIVNLAEVNARDFTRREKLNMSPESEPEHLIRITYRKSVETVIKEFYKREIGKIQLFIKKI